MPWRRFNELRPSVRMRWSSLTIIPRKNCIWATFLVTSSLAGRRSFHPVGARLLSSMNTGRAARAAEATALNLHQRRERRFDIYKQANPESIWSAVTRFVYQETLGLLNNYRRFSLCATIYDCSVLYKSPHESLLTICFDRTSSDTRQPDRLKLTILLVYVMLLFCFCFLCLLCD